jgi:hypothetical protein
MKVIRIMLVLLSLTLISKAQVPVVDAEAEDGKAVIGSVSLGVQSKYLDPRFGVVYTDEPVAQNEVAVSMLGFDFSIWHNASLERRAGKTDGDEVDYTASRTFEGQKGSLEVGLSYYDFTKLCKGNKDNAYAGYLELASPNIMKGDKLSGVNYVRLESVLATPGSSFEGGVFTTVGCRVISDLADDLRLLGDMSFTRNDGVYGLEPDVIFAYTWSAEVDKWGWTFSPNFVLTVPFHGGAETVFGLSASREF